MVTSTQASSKSDGLLSQFPIRKWTTSWFKPQLDDPTTFFREQTVRVFSFGFLIIFLLGFAASALLYPVGQSWLPLILLLSAAVGTFAAMVAIHQKRLNLSAWVLAITFLVGAYGVLLVFGYQSHLTFPAFLLAFGLWTLVQPRNSLWPLLGVTTVLSGVIIMLQTEHTSDFGIGIVSDFFLLLLAETVIMFTFRLEFDNRLDTAEKARAQAEKADQLKTQFLSNVSHEFRTPLNAINGYVEIMISGIGGQLTERHMQFSKKIYTNTQLLRLMVDDLLDLARIESGSVQIATVPTSPAELVTKLVDSQQGLVQGKSVVLREKIGGGLPEVVQWDARKVQQVLTNLIGNAIKFTDQGVVEVGVSADGDQIQLSVSDTGVGMPADAPTYIFEKFRQVDSTEGRKHGGNGLGLSITRGLVEEMDGTIAVKTELGKGSTFTVTLPQKMKDTVVPVKEV